MFTWGARGLAHDHLRYLRDDLNGNSLCKSIHMQAIRNEIWITVRVAEAAGSVHLLQRMRLDVVGIDIGAAFLLLLISLQFACDQGYVVANGKNLVRARRIEMVVCGRGMYVRIKRALSNSGAIWRASSVELKSSKLYVWVGLLCGREMLGSICSRIAVPSVVCSG